MAGKLGTGIVPGGDAMFIADTDHSFVPAGPDPAPLTPPLSCCDIATVAAAVTVDIIGCRQ